MTFVDAINVVELIWWPAVGLAIAWRSRGTQPLWRRLGYTAAVLLLLFGLSDGIELSTGAWWKPWWLLVWKGTCITGLVACTVTRYRWLRNQSSGQAADVG